ncbi:aminotransferase class V-fold PLP-dependent enzyme, partial [Thermodesulfobacteriota bacterium]
AFLSGLRTGTGVHLYGPGEGTYRLSVFSVGVEGVDPGEAARRLENEFGILVRSGLHCAPWAHKTLGTFPEGSIRVSFGHGNTADDAAYTADALRRLAKGAGR